MNKQMLGVIDASPYTMDLRPLTKYRTVAAIPFAGRYRLIDFMLSNLVHSGIHSVALFPRINDRSLVDHLGSGKEWDLDRKRDGLFVFPPMSNNQQDLTSIVPQLRYHIDYFLRSTQKYTVITNSYTIGHINFKDVLRHHIRSNAHITEVYHHGRPLQIYVLETALLIDLIYQENIPVPTLSEFIRACASKYILSRYEHDGYAAVIFDIESYFNNSLEMLSPLAWKQVFIKDRPIYTKVKDEPPTRYMKTANVKNSMVANGCVIEGYVENSIVFRGVKIEKGAIVKNSIVMQKSMVKENSLLNYVILDKDVKVERNTELVGEPEHPYVIEKGTVQGALMNS
ncbi:sugar phosphate nucleotidyltransferase [Bacillus songklensis]|uniref:Sugar phosphate nucleotidyltransferase n=1 Tax=Bacillus songklensis TaxID=1069116 RepID=A0ABV8B4V7_9BACI